MSEVAAIGCRSAVGSSTITAREVAYVVRQSLTAPVDVIEVSMPGLRDPGPITFTEKEFHEYSQPHGGDLEPSSQSMVDRLLWLLLPLSYFMVLVAAMLSARWLHSAGIVVLMQRR